MTQQDARAIAEAANEEDLVPEYQYSGRGMFGKDCLAVHTLNQADLARLFYRLGSMGNDADCDLTQLIFDYRVDNLGQGYVIYWPNIKWEG